MPDFLCVLIKDRKNSKNRNKIKITSEIIKIDETELLKTEHNNVTAPADIQAPIQIEINA